MGVLRASVGQAVAMALLVSGCSSDAGVTSGSAPTASPSAASPSTGASSHGSLHDPHEEGDPPRVPLRQGERFVRVGLPGAYSPKAPTTGTDDYRCFLLDPAVRKDAFVTGIDVVPDRAELVHHVILFRVPPRAVAAARARDEAQEGQGWTCFGGSGLEVPGASLDNAPWLGAWAPGGGEGVLAPDIGIPLKAGSQVVMQVHYNLLAGTGLDRSEARLRLAAGTRKLAPLETILMPAPVELPCRPGVDEPLCDRDAALADVTARFGAGTGQTTGFLNLMCRGVGPSPVQSCTRPITERATVRAVAGHMHLLGREIKIELNPGRPDAQTILDVPVWNFDDQASMPVDEPMRLVPGDVLRVTCRHDQKLRDLVPELKEQPERYVVWGEGTTDEMCLGIVLVTRP